MPLLDGKGLSWLIKLFKKYIGITKSISGDTTDTLVLMNDDLDNYTTIGNFYCNPDSDAKTVSNNPSGMSFILKVYSGMGYSYDTSNGNYLTQRLEDLNGNIWIRYKTTGDWSAWSKIFTIAGDSTVGSGANPIYMSDGTITASGSTVGSGAQFVYLNSGNITASNSTVGGTAQPVYLNSGTVTALSSTIGSGTQPAYLSSGKVTASSSTVGASDTPVYLKSGVFTKCGSISGIESYKLGNPGYVKYKNGLIIQWGTQNPATLTYPLAFTSATSYVVMKNVGSGNKYKIDHREVSYHTRTATNAKTTTYGVYNSQWIAIGY